ncbi:hypothetical protein SAMN05216559_2020 [Halomicrobium zhouii]|uniref:Uncharacterized protein n=1 Tax=Halomicrobium zhouii TaxID=767519 RepID=A0A1I6L515_9EURY|nr:hypothetical protein [Halomicrobium zhouii]SFR98368.1 hypothetical protein SAMN05216559_2020 [Halomicrobium zhouii]
MADRLPSDHDAVETHRATVSQVGRMGRPQVAVPDSVAVDEGEVFRVVLDGEEYHGRVETTLDGDRVIRRAADNARLVREGEGENRLAEWFDGVDVAFGDSVHFDVVTGGHKYGLRSPGERVVYTATDGLDSSLADIARNLEE